MPSRSMSCALPLGAATAGVTGVDFVTGDLALAAADCSAARRARSSSSAFSRSRSYPSCRIRSASSAAFRSASSKLTGAAAFFAPRPPSLDFLGPDEAALATEGVEEFRREAPSLDAGRDATEVVELERREAELTVRGAAVPALADLPMTGGGVGLEDVTGALGAAGLSQEEKKSSSSPPFVAGAETGSAPSTTILSGCLYFLSHQGLGIQGVATHLATSSFTRRASSSLYNSATRLEYFFFVSESLSSAAPPCLVKNSVAEAFPPTFIVRSWLSCQLSRLVDLRDRQHVGTFSRSKHSPNETDVHAHVPVHAGAV